MGRAKSKKALKIPRGVQLRGETIRINFSRFGQRYFISLPELQPTQTDLDWAAGILAKVKRDIRSGSFKWNDHFPNHKLAKTELRSSENLTISELLTIYLKEYASHRKADMTLDNYRYYANRFIKPEFGHLTIPEFRVGHITQWVTRMGNKHISNTTLKSYLSPLRSAFRYAKSQNLVEYNPFIDFEWPEESRQTLQKKRARKKQKKLDVFTLEEISGLLTAGQRPQETHIIQFGFWSGLRPEELFALHWEDIDFNRGIACISRAKVFRRGYTMIEETPEEREVLKEIKTGELGERDLILLPSALSALQRQQPYTHTHSPFVFHADYNNKPWRNTNQFRNRFQKLCVLAGVRYRRPYMMRHTYASMLLKEGENENFVARQLGHVDTQMLRKVYGEFIPDSGTDNGYQLRGDWQAIEELHAPALPAPSS